MSDPQRRKDYDRYGKDGPQPEPSGPGGGFGFARSDPWGDFADDVTRMIANAMAFNADDSIQFILGKQPAGQFPPSWDVGLQGMCVGGQRRITVPPAAGYGKAATPGGKIPPNSTLCFDVAVL